MQKLRGGRVRGRNGLRPRATAAAIEAPRQNAGVVYYQQIVGAQQVWEFPEAGVAQTIACAIQVQHASSSAIGQRLLGNQFLRQVIVELRNQHRPDYALPEITNELVRTIAEFANCGTIERLGDSYLYQPYSMTSEQKHRDEIVRFGKLLHQTGLVAATDGNLSVRLGDGTFLCTPTVMSKGLMEADDLVIVDAHGHKVGGRRNVSSEIAMHLFIYRRRPDVGAVVHAHPPTATGFAAAGMPLDSALCSEIVITLGTVPLANYETPGTPELAEGLAPLVGDHDAILMANHGVVTYGVDLLTAYMNMETVEHYAKIALVTHTLGKQQPLSDVHVNKLREIRQQYHARNQVGAARGDD
jgi:L-fuculose-phosphate aldolase